MLLCKGQAVFGEVEDGTSLHESCGRADEQLDKDIEVTEKELISLLVAGGFGPVENTGHCGSPHADVGLRNVEVFLNLLLVIFILNNMRERETYLDDVED